ncbi:F-box protein SKIP16 [Apostasia shenzhenica]|uniref:F-box protein SKIP16 n=1 Tax=Apostasia shenzhenica TaxID=1088818 RepID=A0A2I0BFX7_9ASPA|nr:F-box protein SKIP16 [Apostasia shenzhenica]
MGLESLEGLILETILLKLGPRDVIAVACVSSRLRSISSDDRLWRVFCASDFDLSSPEDPHGNPTPSFKVAYEMWMRSFSMYPVPLVKRVKQCWSAIRSWMAANFPEANETLRRGATEAEIKQAEDKLGVKIPIPTKVLYRFCDGQDTVAFDNSDARRLAPLGIIGGYKFYGHLVNVHLLSLSQIIEQSKAFEKEIGFTNRKIVVATSYYFEKSFFLSCGNGQLYVGTKDMSSTGEMMPCVPSKLVKPGLPQDALLLWLEEHCRRLHSGILRTRMLLDLRTISIFPDAPHQSHSQTVCSHPEAIPACSIAVTNGVKVRASAVFVPELSSLARKEHFYSYSIRMSLSPDGCILNGIYYSSCQLSSRHWIIKSKDYVIDDVSGDGVIGKYPLLKPNQEEFVYESCTDLPEAPGSIEGSFTFVPGRLGHQEGAGFDVKVAPFLLPFPDYIF